MKSLGRTSILVNCIRVELCAVSFRITGVVFSNLRAERTVSLWSAYDRFIEGCLFTVWVQFSSFLVLQRINSRKRLASQTFKEELGGRRHRHMHAFRVVL